MMNSPRLLLAISIVLMLLGIILPFFDGDPGIGINLLSELFLLGCLGCRTGSWNGRLCDVVEGEKRIINAPFGFPPMRMRQPHPVSLTVLHRM